MSDPVDRSIRRSFASNLVGNSLYSLSQWLLFVVLARLADPAEVGRFALLLAVSAPAFLAIGMNLRVVQATDAERRWSPADYVVVRHVVNLVASVIVIGIFAAHGDGLLLLAGVALAGAKSVEGLSQTYYGYFQQRERHDYVAASMIARSVAGPVGFLGGYLAAEELWGACLGLMVGWLAVQRFLDRPRLDAMLEGAHGGLPRLGEPAARARLVRLVRHAFPLGLDQGVSSLAVNTPRYFVQGTAGGAALGVYSTLGYLAQVISMITSSLGIVVVPRLARLQRDGRRAAFTRLLGLSTLFSVLVSMAALLAALVAGAPVIRLLLGAEYVDQPLLLVLLLGAAAVTLQRSMGRALTGARRFATFLVIDVLTLLATAVSAAVLVPAYGVIGAAWATVAGNLVGTLACLVPVRAVIVSMSAPEPPA